MTALNHILIAIAYALLAAVVAVFASRGFPEIGSDGGAVLGAVVFWGAAILYEVFSRQESQSHVVEEMHSLRLENDDLRDSLDDAWSHVTAIRDALTAYKAEGLHKTREVDSVIAEVKVLQGLIQQFSVAKSAKLNTGEPAERKRQIQSIEKPETDQADGLPAPTEHKHVALDRGMTSYGDDGKMLPIATGHR